jgi:hypothetical protein
MKYVYYGAVSVLVVAIVLFYVLTHRKTGADSGPPPIPHIGSVQLLNGCGTPGAAQVIAELLRNKGFDVKEIGNAPDWNYKSTIIVSRTRDMGTANLIGEALGSKNVILIRNNSGLFDATVFVGEDYLKIADARKE